MISVRTLFYVLCTLALINCAPRVVNVPVPVPCFDKALLPVVVESASSLLRKEDTDGDKIKQILIERERLRQTDTTFRALFSGCV